ncbi:hypothetical protein [Tsukamurella soli]|uniref:PknH-like extracellular domain-containing protein n=1 Tax=Tsukamurella soli TaxID=644556 RepID=A0ABP8K182_9ACTN
MKNTSVAAAALSVAAVAAIAVPTVASAAPAAPASPSGAATALFDANGTPKALAGQMVLGYNNVPQGMNYNASILSGAGAGWDSVWAGLNAVKVAPPECKAAYAGFPIPKGTDAAQTNATGNAISYSIVVAKFKADLGAMKASAAKCTKFTIRQGAVVSQVVAKPLTVPDGGPDSVGVEFDVTARRGNLTQYTISRSYTAVVDGVTVALRGSRATLEPISFGPSDDAAINATIATQIAVIKNPPTPEVLPAPAPKKGKPGAKPSGTAKPAAAPGKPAAAASTTAAPKPN